MDMVAVAADEACAATPLVDPVKAVNARLHREGQRTQLHPRFDDRAVALDAGLVDGEDDVRQACAADETLEVRELGSKILMPWLATVLGLQLLPLPARRPARLSQASGSKQHTDAWYMADLYRRNRQT